MKELIEEFRSRFGELEKRERIALSGLFVFLVVAVFYLAIWTPANEFVANGERDYARHLKLLEYLKSTEPTARVSKRQSGQQHGGGSLLTMVTRTAQTVGVSPSRMQPEGSDALSVWFDAVAFTRLMLFLERLQSGQGTAVRQISVESQDKPGQVSARVVLRN